MEINVKCKSNGILGIIGQLLTVKNISHNIQGQQRALQLANRCVSKHYSCVLRSSSAIEAATPSTACCKNQLVIITETQSIVNTPSLQIYICHYCVICIALLLLNELKSVDTANVTIGGPSLLGLSTYRLWLWYKVCHNVLVMDSCISQREYHMYDTWLTPRITVLGWVITRIEVLGFGYFREELKSPCQLYIDLSTEDQVL